MDRNASSRETANQLIDAIFQFFRGRLISAWMEKVKLRSKFFDIGCAPAG